MAKRTSAGAKGTAATAATVGYEAQLWQMADALRGSMDAAEYKHVVLGLLFLKYISDAFEEKHAALNAEKASGADPEDPDEYRALSIFWVPPEARWGHLKAQARQSTIGQLVDAAMEGIERDNPALTRTTGPAAARAGPHPRSKDGKDRFIGTVRELSQAFALAVPHEEALRIRDDVAFFQAVQAALAKRALSTARPQDELDHAVRQIISRAVAPDGVIDIFAAAGLAKPDISILSDEFLAEVRGMPHRNLTAELLERLLKGEVARRRRKNVVQARSFADMLEQTVRRYQNRAIEADQLIEELIALAKEMREAQARGEALGLTDDELAFYDALETNDSAVKVLGDEALRTIAQELVKTNVTIDWTVRENVRAHLRVLVKRILRRFGYPPDKQERATETVLEQAALLSAEWSAA